MGGHECIASLIEFVDNVYIRFVRYYRKGLLFLHLLGDVIETYCFFDYIVFSLLWTVGIRAKPHTKRSGFDKVL